MDKKIPEQLEEQTIKKMAELWVEEFGAKYPSKTINHHHYVRRRNLERLLFNFGMTVKGRAPIK